MTFSYKLAHPCDLIERRSYQQSNSAQQAAGNETRFGFNLPVTMGNTAAQGED